MTGDNTQPIAEAKPERRSRLASFRGRRWRSRTLLVVLVTAAAVGVGGYSLAAIQGRADQQQERAQEATELAELSAANAEIIARQIHDACERQDDVAAGLGDICQQAEQIAEKPQEPVAVPPTDEQVDSAVQRYCREFSCGGGGPSADQVAAAVRAFCDSRGECRGDPGDDGQDGEDGEDGQDAEPPSDAQIIAAVDTYCATRNECRGAAGLDGVDGQNGRDGIDGIDGRDGVDGEPPLSWTTTRCDMLGQCVIETCVRDEPFDPTQPRYTCSEAPA